MRARQRFHPLPHHRWLAFHRSSRSLSLPHLGIEVVHVRHTHPFDPRRHAGRLSGDVGAVHALLHRRVGRGDEEMPTSNRRLTRFT